MLFWPMIMLCTQFNLARVHVDAVGGHSVAARSRESSVAFKSGVITKSIGSIESRCLH